MDVLFEKDGRKERAKEAAHKRRLEELYAEIGQPTTRANWPIRKVPSTFSGNVAIAMVERTGGPMPLTTRTKPLSLSRSIMFYRRKAPSAKEVQAMRRID